MHRDHPLRRYRILHAGLLVLAAPGLTLAACDERPSRPHASTQRTPEVPARIAAPATPVASELQEIDAPALFERLRSRRKRGTVVNVWASWCGSCREEIPLLLQIQTAVAADGLDFVFVTADEPRDFPKAVELMRSWSGPLPVFAVAGAMTPFKRAMHPSWKGAIPATFLFDDAQKLRHFWEGPVMEHEITPILQGFLAGEPIDGETRPRIVGESLSD